MDVFHTVEKDLRGLIKREYEQHSTSASHIINLGMLSES